VVSMSPALSGHYRGQRYPSTSEAAEGFELSRTHQKRSRPLVVCAPFSVVFHARSSSTSRMAASVMPGVPPTCWTDGIGNGAAARTIWRTWMKGKSPVRNTSHSGR